LEGDAVFRQQERPCGSMNELRIETALEIRQPLADHRLRDRHPACRCRDRARLGDGDECLHGFELEHRSAFPKSGLGDSRLSASGAGPYSLLAHTRTTWESAVLRFIIAAAAAVFLTAPVHAR